MMLPSAMPSAAWTRNLIWFVSVTWSSSLKLRRVHDGAGESWSSVSSSTQLAPPSSDTSITMMSWNGLLPAVFENHRAYSITGEFCDAVINGDVSVVVPPSTSLLHALAALLSVT